MDSFYTSTVDYRSEQLQTMANTIQNEEELATLPNHIVKYFLELLGIPSTVTDENVPEHEVQRPSFDISMPYTPGTDSSSILSDPFSHKPVFDKDNKSPLSNSLNISQILGIPDISTSNDKSTVTESKKRKVELTEDTQYCDDIKYLMGKRGGCQVLWKGHRYTRDRTRNEQTYWACVLKRPPYRCKGRISTRGSFVTSATGHNHVINPSKVAIATLTHEIKTMARTQPEVKSHDIVMHCLNKISGEAGDTVPITDIPRIRTLKKMCQRASKKMKIEDDASSENVTNLSSIRPNINIRQMWPVLPHFSSTENLPVSEVNSGSNVLARYSPTEEYSAGEVNVLGECSEDGYEGMCSLDECRNTLDVIDMLYRVRVAESTVLEQDIENCKHQLNLKEERIKSLRGEVSKLDVALKVAQEGLRKAMTSSDEKVDRSLIKNFFTQYVTVSDDRRQDVLRVISAILGYTEEELKEIEIARQNHGRWLPTLFSGPKNKQPVQPAPVGESFSELFISFLETEANKATLPPRVRTTSQQYRPVSTPPVMGHMRTTSSSSVGSPRSSSPVTTTIKSKALDSRRSPSVSSGHDSMSPPHSAAATPLVPSSLADLLSTKNP